MIVHPPRAGTPSDVGAAGGPLNEHIRITVRRANPVGHITACHPVVAIVPGPPGEREAISPNAGGRTPAGVVAQPPVERRPCPTDAALTETTLPVLLIPVG